MKGLKRIAAAVLAVAMAGSITACGQDTGWIAKSGENVLPVGTYIANMMQNYMYQYMMYGSEDVLKETVDGKTVAQAIQDDAKEDAAFSLAILKKAEEQGISLTEEEEKIAKASVSSAWENNKELYEKNGVAQSSVELVARVSALSNKLFLHTYGPNGEKEVSQDELRTRFEEKYIRAGLMIFPKPQSKTAPADATEEEKAIIEETYNTNLQIARTDAQNWLAKAESMKKDGKTFQDTLFEYDKEYAQDASSVDEAKDRYVLVDRTAPNIPKEVVEELEKAELDTPKMIETEEYFIVCTKQDIKEDTASFESVRENLLGELKGEEFRADLKTYSESLNIEYNDAAISKYVPKKLKIK